MPSDRHRRTRSRSRSPDHGHRSTRTRSRSPSRRHHHHHHHHHHSRRHHHDAKHSKASTTVPARPLPLGARPLSKHDYERYALMFALYLDIQKQKILEELDEGEVKGRWKSFVGKWNRGELAEGWYDPATLQKAVANAGAEREEQQPDSHQRRRESPDYGAVSHRPPSSPRREEATNDDDDDDDDNDTGEDDADDFGPAALPAGSAITAARRSGPAIPRLDDLEMRDELLIDDAAAQQTRLRALRKADRALQKERLDELAPRADAGSRERMLEKRAATTAAHRDYRDAREGGAMAEVGERDLMGGGDGVEEVRARRSEEQRRKNEREVRKEEMLRARAAEREEKFAEHRAKEEKTMEMLRALARARFGGGGGGSDGGE